MASKLGSIIVIVLLSNQISFASSISVKVGTFQNLHRHPKLRSCADMVLKENLYVGGRVHMLTGECEGLNRSWVINQTVQNGYAYTKKVSVHESLIPPLGHETTRKHWSEHFTWTIPGMLREGAIVEIVVECTPNFGVEVDIFDTLDPRKYYQRDWGDLQMIRMSSGLRFRTCDWYNNHTSGCIYGTPQQKTTEMTSEMKRKVSFRAHTGSIEFLVDDHEVFMVHTTLVDLTTLRTMEIMVLDRVLLHSVEFIDA